MIITYACQITEELIPNIIEDAALFGLNVDYITDTIEYNADLGFDTTYAILSVNSTTKQATFTEMVKEDFDECWHFAGGLYGARPHWKTISLTESS